MSNLVNYLFDTDAFRVCPENKPFWYTAGKIGPFYVNTHFLYGSETKANELLSFIDSAKEDVLTCPKAILDKTLTNYESDKIYKDIIDTCIDFINKNIGVDNFEYISGGERRDWFFSLIIAEKLNKPHITIYKDLSCVTGNVKTEPLNGATVLHIADLITEASSYERAWIPAIKEQGGVIKYSLAVVDRVQGGKEVLAKYDIESYSLVNIDKGMFDSAKTSNLLSDNQYNMIIDYTKDPDGAMKKFMDEHPEFLENALNSDPKTADRAKLCIEKGFYK